MSSPEVMTKQSSGVAMVGVTRTLGRKGRAEVPWFVEVIQGTSKEDDDHYNKMEGKVCCFQ